MTDRRPLIAGLNPAAPAVDPAVEKRFVFAGGKADPAPAADPAAPPASRSPLTTRLRADYAAALKRASLERQLAGTTPHTVQDILEAALGPWLSARGYLP